MVINKENNEFEPEDDNRESFILINLSNKSGAFISAELESDIHPKLLSYILSNPIELMSKIKTAVIKECMRKGYQDLLKKVSENYQAVDESPIVAPNEVFR